MYIYLQTLFMYWGYLTDCSSHFMFKVFLINKKSVCPEVYLSQFLSVKSESKHEDLQM